MELLTKIIGSIFSVFINKEKVASITNATTAIGVTSGAFSYFQLMQSNNELVCTSGTVLLIMSALITLIKDEKK